MHQRMLDKSIKPTCEDMTAWCGENALLFSALNTWLSGTFSTVQTLAFPYGSKYGWCVAHRIKTKLICNIFPEQGAFTVMLRLSDKQYQAAYPGLLPYTQTIVDGRYPCGDGGWIHYRVSEPGHLMDIQRLITCKFPQKKAAN